MQVKMIRCVCVRGISQMQSLKERVKKEKGLPGAISFVAISLAIFSNQKEHLIGVKNVENKKPLCVVPSFKIYHTEKDFKKHGQLLREGVMAMEGVDNCD